MRGERMSLLTRASLFMNSSGLIQPQNSLGEKKRRHVWQGVSQSQYHHSIQHVLNMSEYFLWLCVCVFMGRMWEAINHSDHLWVVLWNSRRELAVVVSGLRVYSCLWMSASVLAHIIPCSHYALYPMSSRADFLFTQVCKCKDLFSNTPSLLCCLEKWKDLEEWDRKIMLG